MKNNFLSKIIYIATSHSNGVMVNKTFPVMDEVIQVRAIAEFVHQDHVKDTLKAFDNFGSKLQKCTK